MPCEARMSVNATKGSRLSEASDDRSNTYPNTFVFQRDPYLTQALKVIDVANKPFRMSENDSLLFHNKICFFLIQTTAECGVKLMVV